MSTPLPNYKREALEKQLRDLTADYTAANDQLSSTLNAADKLRLQRQLEGIDQEIGRVKHELQSLSASLSVAPLPFGAEKPDNATTASSQAGRKDGKTRRGCKVEVAIIVALIGLIGVVAAPFATQIAKRWLASPTPIAMISQTPPATPDMSGTPTVGLVQQATATSTTRLSLGMTPTAPVASPFPSTATATPAPSATPTPSATPRPQAIIRGDRVNLRAGPGTEYPSVGLADRGELFTVVGKNADPPTWWQVDRGNEQKAWISAGFADIMGSVATVPVVTVPPPPSTPSPRILYDWGGAKGWTCWEVRVDPGSGASYGTGWLPENGVFKVDFLNAPGNVGQLMYHGGRPGCPELTVPMSARVYAQVQLLVVGLPVNAEIFMQSTGYEPWFAGRPRTSLSDGTSKTLAPTSWVTGVPERSIERTGQQFVTLGIEFNLGGAGPSPSEQRFLIKRVWVTER